MEISLNVYGETVAVDLNRLLVISEAPELDRQVVAAKLAYWGKVWAEAQREYDEADIAYRHWRAVSRSNFHNATDDKGKNLAEAKITDLIEATAEFRMLKTQIAEAQFQVNAARVVYESLGHKARMLAFLGSRDWSEYKAAGDIQTAPEDDAWVSERAERVDERRAKIKQAVGSVFVKDAERGE